MGKKTVHFGSKRAHNPETLECIRKKNTTLLETLLLKIVENFLVCNLKTEGVHTQNIASENYRFSTSK